MLKLSELDQQLQQRAEALSRVFDFRRLRSSFSPSEKAWWWHLDKLDSHVNPKYAWFWKSISIVIWTVSLGLLLNIASRFLVGGVDVLGVTAVGLTSLLALLQTKNELTDSGLELSKQILSKLRVSRRFQEQSQFIATLVLFLLLFGIFHLLPSCSNRLIRDAQDYAQSGNASDALRTYQRAIALNPNNVHIHYDLGRVYEELQEFDEAKKEYRIAMQGNVLEAYNDLARLYLQEKKYSQAAILLQKGLKRDIRSPQLTYTLYKNLGWTRFEQNRCAEAENLLDRAIKEQKQKWLIQYQEKYPASRASAHCLMAKVREGLKKNALEEWRKCKDLVKDALDRKKDITPEEDDWMHMAEQRLKRAKTKQERLNSVSCS